MTSNPSTAGARPPRIGLLLGLGVSAALVLAFIYSALERAALAEARSLDWSDVAAMAASRGPAGAEAVLRGRLRAHPRDALLYYYLARLNYENGRAEPALREADEAISLGYAQEGAHLLKAMVRGRLMGDRAAERALASKALVYDPAYDEAYLVRAEAEYWLKDYGSCVSDAGVFVRMSPEVTDGYELSQLCLEGMRDYDGAEKAALTILKLQPRNHAALWRLGRLCAIRGRYEEAVQRFSAAIRLSGGRSRYYQDRSAACASLGDFSCAARDMESAAGPGLQKTATYYLLLGEALYRVGDLKRAREAAEKAVSLAPENYTAYDLRGRLRAEAGDLGGAGLDFGKAERMAPGKDPELPFLLKPSSGPSKRKR